jgi:SAM-dependent methyltransferase
MEDASSLFDANYYQCGLGSPYERNAYWLNFFGGIAEEIIRSLKPKSVMDAGCALGFLVESFWDRGVECYGFDISEFGISQVRRDIQPYCAQASIVDPIKGHYDLITCIEVLEHLQPEQTETAIANLAAATETILFSSTPSDLSEATHFNVRPVIGWLNLFKNVGFSPDYVFDAGFVAPHAILLRKRAPVSEDTLLLLSDKIRWKCAFVERGNRIGILDQKIAELTAAAATREKLLAAEQQGPPDESAALLEELRKEFAEASKELAELRSREGQGLRERQKLLAKAQLAQQQLAAVKSETETLRREGAEKKAAIDAALNEAARGRTEIERTRQEFATAVSTLAPAIPELARIRFREEVVSWRNIASTGLKQARLALTFRRSAMRKKQNELLHAVEIVGRSPFFDPVWYLKNYPDIAVAEINPLIHYLEHGVAEGRNPGPQFDAKWYLVQYPDVAEDGANPLIHYLEYGAKEGRACHPAAVAKEHDPGGAEAPAPITSDAELLRRSQLIAASPLFNAAWYLEQYPDVAAAEFDPIVHYLQHGAPEGRNPGPEFDAKWYLKHYPDVASAGLNPLLHYLEYGAAENRATQAVADPREAGLLLENQFLDSMPLATFLVPRSPRRITIVTNSINTGSLYGGVGTALILAALAAKRVNASIRLVTRREQASAGNFADILAINGIAWQDDIEFLYAPVDGNRHVAVSDNDIFLTTSWWTTRGVRNVIDPAKIFYLLQEDERMFYPYGDERLRCEEVMKDSAMHFVVNSKLLYEHLTTGTEALENISRRGMWFEPAFPNSNYYPDQAPSTGKKQFFFYARPNNTRNLYWRGLEAISCAIESGILPPQEWEFNFAGRGIERLVLPGKAALTIHQDMSWAEYAGLVRRMDLALCLMDTPHPSYPPLDLAASGAVVVTNRRGNKTSLAQYSENILCADSGVQELGAALASAAKVVNDDAIKFSNYSRNGLLRDWNVALEPTVARLAEIIASGG